MDEIRTNSGVTLRVSNGSTIYTSDGKAFWCCGSMLVGNGTVISYKSKSAEEALDMVAALWCCTIKVDIENSKGQYIEKDKQEATKDGSESTKIQHGI